MKLSIAASLIALLLSVTQLNLIAASDVGNPQSPETKEVEPEPEVHEELKYVVQTESGEGKKQQALLPSDKETIRILRGEIADEEMDDIETAPGTPVSEGLKDVEVLLETLRLYRDQQISQEPTVPPTLSAFAKASKVAGEQIQEEIKKDEAPGSSAEDVKETAESGQKGGVTELTGESIQTGSDSGTEGTLTEEPEPTTEQPKAKTDESNKEPLVGTSGGEEPSEEPPKGPPEEPPKESAEESQQSSAEEAKFTV